ncbi:uncharacterized protein METZ01_LOCUS462962, partial [marine metagenome]
FSSTWLEGRGRASPRERAFACHPSASRSLIAALPVLVAQFVASRDRDRLLAYHAVDHLGIRHQAFCRGSARAFRVRHPDLSRVGMGFALSLSCELYPIFSRGDVVTQPWQPFRDTFATMGVGHGPRVHQYVAYAHRNRACSLARYTVLWRVRLRHGSAAFGLFHELGALRLVHFTGGHGHPHPLRSRRREPDVGAAIPHRPRLLHLLSHGNLAAMVANHCEWRIHLPCFRRYAGPVTGWNPAGRPTRQRV